MTERRKFLLQILGNIQNHPFNQSRDIMTFAGMCTDDELAAHVQSSDEQVGRYEKRTGAK